MDISNLLANQQFEQVLELLHDSQDDVSIEQKMQALIGLERYEESITLFEKHLHLIEDRYYEILSLYLVALTATKEYDKATSIINEELSMPYIPFEYENMFLETYDFIIETKRNTMEYQDRITFKSEEEIIDVLNNQEDINILFECVHALKSYNIRKIMPELQKFLQDKNKNSIVKTFIMELLISQQISTPILVDKEGVEIEFLPLSNQMISETMALASITNLIQENNEKDPSHAALCIEILDVYLYSIYPLLPEDDEEYQLVACCIDYYVKTLQFDDIKLEEIATIYEVEPRMVQEFLPTITKLITF